MKQQIEIINKFLTFTNLVPEIDGKTYTFKYRYDVRQQSWFLSIGEVLTERRLVCGIDILRHYHHLDVPPQKLELVPQETVPDAPNYDQLGTTVKLVYGDDE